MRFADLVSRQGRLQKWFRGAMPPGRTTPLELIMIQATPFCNIDCRYCYLPNRSDKRRFDPDLLAPLFQKLDQAGLLGDEISVVWHAGEPLVLPVDYYRDAFARIARLTEGKARIVHHFQTNGILLRQEHCDLAREYTMRVAVSIDGPARFHNQNRVTRGGKGSHAEAVAAIRLLQQNKMPVSVINVLTAEALEHPDEIHDFYRQLGVATICFNVEEHEGDHGESSFSMATDRAFYAFLLRYFELARTSGTLMDLREFRSGFQPARAFQPPAPRGSSETNPFSILSVDVTGRLFTFSPELVDLTDADGNGYSFGDLATVDFRQVFDDPRFRRIAEPIAEGVRACAETCAYFGVCGGGAPVNKLSELGTFAGTETVFCRMTRQVLSDAIDDFTARTIAETVAERRMSRMTQ